MLISVKKRRYILLYSFVHFKAVKLFHITIKHFTKNVLYFTQNFNKIYKKKSAISSPKEFSLTSIFNHNVNLFVTLSSKKGENLFEFIIPDICRK